MRVVKQKNLESGFKLKAGTYTLDQVIQRVEEIISEEPLRCFMPAWVAAVDGRSVVPGVGLREVMERGKLPACGTAACVCGWLGLVTRDEVMMGIKQIGPVLGLNYVERFSEPQMRNELAAKSLGNLFGQTKLDGDEVVERLKAFREEYSDVVKHTTVTVPTREQLRKEARKGR